MCLKIPSEYFEKKKHFWKVLEGASLVREIHTYGAQINLGESGDDAVQHLGLGKMMLAKAEEITKEFGLNKIAVIAGIGVREYFRKNGYTLSEEYMVKTLNVQ